MSVPTDPRVLMGANTLDDAAVYRLRDDLALIQSLDFITPVVDDPYEFGAIVAANALSDVYAMGGTPLLALNIVAYPVRSLPLGLLEEILKGGQDKAAGAGVFIAGGHSIDDPEPKYGMAVAGIVHPERLITNSGARPSDLLILTKPLGTGIITTGIDRLLAEWPAIEEAISSMMSLNKEAAEAMSEAEASACTDVTGFGLLGHLHEMAVASGLSAEVALDAVPLLPQVRELAEAGAVPGGTFNNRRYLEAVVTWPPGISREAQLILFDAQTSGGLLIAISPERKKALLKALEEREVSCAVEVGRMVSGEPGKIRVLS